MKSNPAVTTAKPSADKATDENTPSFIEALVGQIADLAGDRKAARELNGFIRYQLSGLSRSVIDQETSKLGIGTPGADLFATEVIAAVNAVAKKTEDRDAAALLRRFAKVMEADYACVRSAHLRRAR